MTLSAVRLGDVGTPGSSPGTIYTVPAGKRAILRDARMWVKNGAGARTAVLYIVPAIGTTVTVAGSVAALPDTLVSLVDAFIVLEAGDEVRVYVSAGASEVVLSGHEFTLP